MTYHRVPLFAANFNNVVGLLVFMEMHHRILGGKFGRIPKPISEDAFSMSGYCIDAPHFIPAGSCYYDEIGPPDEDGPQWIVSQSVLAREGDKL